MIYEEVLVEKQETETFPSVKSPQLRRNFWTTVLFAVSNIKY